MPKGFQQKVLEMTIYQKLKKQLSSKKLMANFTEALSNVVLYGWSNVSKFNGIIILIQQITYIFKKIINLI